MDDSDTLPFPSRLDARHKRPPVPDDEVDETVAPGNAFAVVRGMRTVPVLRFLCTRSIRFAMAYAYQPIVWSESPGLILLEYPGFFTVLLAGKNLGQLEDRLCEHRVTWIRECDDAQAALLATAVTRIERMHSYPSREGKAGSGA